MTEVLLILYAAFSLVAVIALAVIAGVLVDIASYVRRESPPCPPAS